MLTQVFDAYKMSEFCPFITSLPQERAKDGNSATKIKLLV